MRGNGLVTWKEVSVVVLILACLGGLIAWAALRDPGPCANGEAQFSTTVVGGVGSTTLYCPHPAQVRQGLACICPIGVVQ